MSEIIGTPALLNIPSRVVFFDNGVIQRREKAEAQNGQPMLKAIAQWVGSSGGETGMAVSPFFWIELSGVREQLIECIDAICEQLTLPADVEALSEWFVQSLSSILVTPELVAEFESLICSGLEKHRGWFLPGLEARLYAMWESEKREPLNLIRHLAVDRLANRLTRKNSKLTQDDPIGVGNCVLGIVANLIEQFPGMSPFRLLMIAW